MVAENEGRRPLSPSQASSAMMITGYELKLSESAFEQKEQEEQLPSSLLKTRGVLSFLRKRKDDKTTEEKKQNAEKKSRQKEQKKEQRKKEAKKYPSTPVAAATKPEERGQPGEKKQKAEKKSKQKEQKKKQRQKKAKKYPSTPVAAATKPEGFFEERDQPEEKNTGLEKEIDRELDKEVTFFLDNQDSDDSIFEEDNEDEKIAREINPEEEEVIDGFGFDLVAGIARDIKDSIQESLKPHIRPREPVTLFQCQSKRVSLGPQSLACGNNQRQPWIRDAESCALIFE